MDMKDVEWTVEYFKQFNKIAEELGLPQVILIETEDGGYVFKDKLHEYLGIGAVLTRRES